MSNNHLLSAKTQYIAQQILHVFADNGKIFRNYINGAHKKAFELERLFVSVIFVFSRRRIRYMKAYRNPNFRL